MKKSFVSTALVAAVSYILSHFFYGGAEFADMGVTLVPAKAAELGLPTIASLVWLVVKNGFPSLGGSVDKILKLISWGKVGLLSPAPKTAHPLLNLLNTLEMEAASLGIPCPGTSAVRTAALEKLKPDGGKAAS